MASGFLSDSDSFTLQMEHDPLLRSTIVAVALLDSAPDMDALRYRFERATRLAPGFRCRIEGGLPPILPPRWVPDSGFDLAWHIRRVAAPAPHTLDTVLDFGRAHGMTAFDPARPRWDVTVIEGMEGGRSALVIKVHHALTDGIGGIQLAQHVVDLERAPASTPPMPDLETPDIPGGWRAGAETLRRDGERLLSGLGTAAALLPRLARRVLSDPLRSWERAGEVAGSVLKLAAPITNTLSPVMVDRGMSWHYDALEVPLAGLRNAAHLASGTMNDAFLAAIGGGLARYHAEKEHLVEELRVTMPISLRHDSDEMAGNHITLVRMPIPLGDHDPISRMIEVDASSRRWRGEPGLDYSDTVAAVLNALPTAVTGGMLRHVDLVASNVPGFDLPVFVAGAELEGFYVFGPPIGAALNVTLMSYRDTCCVGVNTDGGAVPDPTRLMECLVAGFQEVVDLTGDGHQVRLLTG